MPGFSPYYHNSYTGIDYDNNDNEYGEIDYDNNDKNKINKFKTKIIEIIKNKDKLNKFNNAAIYRINNKQPYKQYK
uniref:Uncharacterized protein n=1 Tax=Pithovirus LCPAC102 TaxID=2506587 RepID=A0A481Z526_9VIRU|nr:MAG: hypothetical protein LCPAC102_00190 [Pithovirus LCPAC102]